MFLLSVFDCSSDLACQTANLFETHSAMLIAKAISATKIVLRDCKTSPGPFEGLSMSLDSLENSSLSIFLFSPTTTTFGFIFKN